MLFQTSVSGGDEKKLPPWVASIDTFDAYPVTWCNSTGGCGDDPRALELGTPGEGGRAVGAYHCAQNQLPQFSFAIDVALTEEAEKLGDLYQLALYILDFDRLGRRIVVDFKSGYPTLDPISPTTYVPDSSGGVWVVVQYHASMRIRVTQLIGAESVASAIMFDKVAL